MTEQEREELIEKMANAMFASKQYNGCFALMDMARAALAVAEPVIREQCAKIARQKLQPHDIGGDLIIGAREMSDSYIQAVEKNIDAAGERTDEITRLREENARLREALKPFADISDKDKDWGTLRHMWDTLRAAAAAIREGGE